MRTSIVSTFEYFAMRASPSQSDFEHRLCVVGDIRKPFGARGLFGLHLPVSSVVANIAATAKSLADYSCRAGRAELNSGKRGNP